MHTFTFRFSRIPRLLLLVTLLCRAVLTAQAQGGGEPVDMNATLTIDAEGTPVTAVLDEITRKKGIRFAYDPEDIRQLPAVTGHFKNIRVYELLGKCLEGTNFKYETENDFVVIYDTSGKTRKFTVSGTVYDPNKNPLAGASVILKGGNGQGVSADGDGRFSITFTSKTSPAVLEIGFLGMESRRIAVTGSAKGLKVSLKEGGTQIEDVVVNGMFTRNKNTYTGSVTTIKGEDLVSISNTNIMTALSAVTPGMVVVDNNALGSNPNAIPEILIRGSNSIATSAEEKAYNNPLIILDGAEITMEELYDLDMYEIERIDVLKDAQAAIVYGDRAANGVIVIERQQVTDSKPRLSYNFVPELSIPDLSSMNLCNAAQKLELERLAGLYTTENGSMDEAYAYKLQNVRRGVNTDWIRAPLRVPFSHTHSLSLSGRAQKIDYRTSLRFSDKYGVMKGDNRRNYTLNFSIGYHMRDKLTLRYTANYTLTDGASTGEGYVRDRIRSIKTILITVFTIAFSLVVLVYGPILLKLVFGKVLGTDLANAAWVAFRWPVTMGLYFLMISYNYYVLPTERVPYRDIVPGSIFASIGFLVVTIVYNIYTKYSVNYDILYGSFSNIVVLLMWFWFISWVMCLGITTNRVWWATRKKNPIPIAVKKRPRRKPINII